MQLDCWDFKSEFSQSSLELRNCFQLSNEEAGYSALFEEKKAGALAIAGSDCKLVNDGRHGTECCKVGSFIKTGQHFFIRRRAKNGTKGFSALLTGFGKSLVSTVAHLGSDACQVSHLTSVGRLTLISTHLSKCSASNVTDRRLAQLF